jgi:ATP-dependent Lon protease
MICKYCHSNSHIIDVCPTIICKKCKNIGHPQWLCKDKKNLDKNLDKNINININKNIDKKIDKKVDIKVNNFEKKYLFNDELKKPINELKIQKNINFYLKIIDKEWGVLGDR